MVDYVISREMPLSCEYVISTQNGEKCFVVGMKLSDKYVVKDCITYMCNLEKFEEVDFLEHKLIIQGSYCCLDVLSKFDVQRFLDEPIYHFLRDLIFAYYNLTVSTLRGNFNEMGSISPIVGLLTDKKCSFNQLVDDLNYVTDRFEFSFTTVNTIFVGFSFDLPVGFCFFDFTLRDIFKSTKKHKVIDCEITSYYNARQYRNISSDQSLGVISAHQWHNGRKLALIKSCFDEPSFDSVLYYQYLYDSVILIPDLNYDDHVKKGALNTAEALCKRFSGIPVTLSFSCSKLSYDYESCVKLFSLFVLAVCYGETENRYIFGYITDDVSDCHVVFDPLQTPLLLFDRFVEKYSERNNNTYSCTREYLKNRLSLSKKKNNITCLRSCIEKLREKNVRLTDVSYKFLMYDVNVFFQKTVIEQSSSFSFKISYNNDPVLDSITDNEGNDFEYGVQEPQMFIKRKSHELQQQE